MKAIINNRIFMLVPEMVAKKLGKILTYELPTYADPDKGLVIRNLRIVNPNLEGKQLISIPSGRQDLIPSDYTIVDKRSVMPVSFPEPRMTLRESQQEILEQVDDSCLINAKPGWGKTVTALHIARKLGQKTLIVVHTVQLRNQWENEIRKIFGISPGVVGSGKFNLDGPIVVANSQTLVKKLPQLARVFGTIIIDEVHHAPAPTFSTIVDKLYCRYKIGLSGTLQRKDGKHVILNDYFGHKRFIPDKENVVDPVIYVANSGINFPAGSDLEGSSHWALRVNALLYSKVYQDYISSLAKIASHMGHKVLVVGDRVEFLKACHEQSEGRSVLITGITEDKEGLIKLIESGEKSEIYATQAMFSEGISINPLSALILGTPINNEPLLEQLIGRVQRIHPGKIQPIVIDIKLQGHTGENQFNTRLGHYLKQGYTIKYL